MTLETDIDVSVGTFSLRARLAVAPGEILAVLGPNGSGKSTLLDAIAGHVLPDGGHVRLAGRTLDDDGHGGRVHVPVERRRVGLIGQQALLFPHLSALENVAFAPRAAGAGRAAARALATEWLDRVGVADLAARRPTELSGGQQQRVAIARALASDPEALLLDEPFAALDVQTASAVRRVVAEVRDRTGVPMLLVTHDALDAVVLGDRAAVLHDGRIVQQGATAQVLGDPQTPFVAALAGMNLVTGVAVDERTVRVDGGDGAVVRLSGSRPVLVPGQAATAAFPPAAVRLRPGPVGADERNRWRGTVATLEAAPGGLRLQTAEHPEIGVEIPSAAAVAAEVRPGAVVAFQVAAEDVVLRRVEPAVLP